MRPSHILLVEDNEGDTILTLNAFEDSKIKAEISVARNGQEALDYLFNTGNDPNAIIPDLILLDINLPILSGHEVLKKIKENDDLRKIPVIMLSTSSHHKDVEVACSNHVNGYLTKPIEMDKFLEVILKIEGFWLQFCTSSK